jgi:O-Antigen ligase
MPIRAVRGSLFLAALLLVWGPPAFRAAGRELDAALADPFALDPAALLQVGAWVFADVLVLLLLISHVARGTGFLSDLLANRPARWYGVYGLLGLASVTYSGSPFYTAYFAHKILVGLLVIALLDWHWPAARGSRGIQVLFIVYGLQAAAIGILYFVHREWVLPFAAGDGPEAARVTGGVFADYGRSALFAGLFFLTVLLFGGRPVYRACAGVAYLVTWWLVVLSETRATMATAAAFLIIMLYAHPRIRVHGALILTGAGIGITFLLPTLLQEIVSTGTRRGQSLSTLSGRTEAFAYLIERWQESPMLGFGYASGTRDMLLDFIARRGLHIGSGHDVLSTVLTDLGLVGLFVLAAALVTAWSSVVRLFRATSADQEGRVRAYQAACILLGVTLHGIVDKSFAAPSLVFIIAIVGTWTLRKRHPTRLPRTWPGATVGRTVRAEGVGA